VAIAYIFAVISGRWVGGNRNLRTVKTRVSNFSALPNGIPSHLCQSLACLDRKYIPSVFYWVKPITQVLGAQLHPDFRWQDLANTPMIIAQHKAIHIVSAWASGASLSAGADESESKS